MADILDLTVASTVASRHVVALRAEDTLDQARTWLGRGEAATRHQGFPVLDAASVLVGVLTQRDLRNAQAEGQTQLVNLVRLPVRYVYEDTTLRQVTDHMLNHNIGRMPVMTRDKQPRLVGFLTRSDVLAAQRRNLEESRTEPPTITFAKRNGR